MSKLRNQELLNNIAEELKRVRESKKLTQEDVYNDTGIHIARIELAKVNLTISTLSTICTYYQVELHELLSKCKG